MRCARLGASASTPHRTARSIVNEGHRSARVGPLRAVGAAWHLSDRNVDMRSPQPIRSPSSQATTRKQSPQTMLSPQPATMGPPQLMGWDRLLSTCPASEKACCVHSFDSASGSTGGVVSRPIEEARHKQNGQPEAADAEVWRRRRRYNARAGYWQARPHSKLT